MARFIARRLLFSLPVLFGVTILIYVLLWFAPGDPALSSLGIYATPEQLETLRRQLDLDKPIYVLYVRWLGQIIRGDFGVSLITKEYVSTLIGHSLSITLQLTAVSMVMVLLIAFPTGIISAVKRNSISDMLSRIFSLLGISMPNFWLALLFITFIAVGLGWFPPGGYVSPDKGFGPWLQALILPSLSIAAAPASALSRMVRASMLDVLSKDYIRTARAKGQRERWVVLRHALRNSLMAPLTIIGMQIGYLMGGAIIVEVIFFFPGMGRLLLEAGIDQDYSVVQGVALVSAVAFILVNVLVDFVYMLIDPRIRDSA
ncbi:MAG: ABC transporter permease [Chloroflexi bacterium]|nr:ABC transporter permease [Chloroflexota bacterium]